MLSRWVCRCVAHDIHRVSDMLAHPSDLLVAIAEVLLIAVAVVAEVLLIVVVVVSY